MGKRSTAVNGGKETGTGAVQVQQKSFMRQISRIQRPYTLIILPAIIITILFLIPFFWGIGLSFTNYRLNLPVAKWNWGRTYAALLTSLSFWKATLRTLQFTLLAVSIELLLGFGIAFLLSTETFMAKILRRIIVFPLMIAPIIGTIMLKLMMNNKFGVINYFLSFVGGKDFPWGASPNLSMFTVILVDIWIFTPFMIVIILAGLRALPREPFEAAIVDGSKGLSTMLNITLPMVMPTVLIALIFRVIDSIKVFDVIWGMTGGGPGDSTTVFSILGYIFTFGSLDVAKGTAIMLLVWVGIMFLGNKLVAYWQGSRARLGDK
jgi:multiple sugar transport system permease protein